MAIREVRTIGDDILGKVCKPVKQKDERLMQLLEDMFETMYETGGVGIAAPQVGVLKRVVCMDVGDGNQYVMINPEIIELSGEQTGMEGCLSVPGKRGQVTRANYAKVKALNENWEEIIIEGEELLARCIQHECDHLDGILYVSKVEGELVDKEVEEDEDEE